MESVAPDAVGGDISADIAGDATTTAEATTPRSNSEKTRTVVAWNGPIVGADTKDKRIRAAKADIGV